METRYIEVSTAANTKGKPRRQRSTTLSNWTSIAHGPTQVHFFSFTLKHTQWHWTPLPYYDVANEADPPHTVVHAPFPLPCMDCLLKKLASVILS